MHCGARTVTENQVRLNFIGLFEHFEKPDTVNDPASAANGDNDPFQRTPLAILRGKLNHRKPWPPEKDYPDGDLGIQFEPT